MSTPVNDIEASAFGAIPRSAYVREFNSAHHPIAILTMDHRILDANSAFLENVGVTFDEVHLVPIGELWDFDVDQHAEGLARRLEEMHVYTALAGPSLRRPATPPATLTYRPITDRAGGHIGYSLAPTTDQAKREQRKVSLDVEGLQLSFDQISVGMLLTGMDGYAIKCNPAMTRLFGRTVDEIATTELLAMIWPDDRERVIDQATRLIAGEFTSYSGEIRLLAGDGTPVWVHETATCVNDADGKPVHFMSQFVDIRERKEAEAELLESQATNRFLFDGTPVPLVQIDADLQICAANAALTRLLGRDPIGLGIDEVVHHDDLARLADQAGTVAPDTDWIIDMRIRRDDGSERVVRSHGRIHQFDDGRFRSATAAWHDITDAQAIEERLRVQASTDPLTGLPHRATFLERLEAAVAVAPAPNTVAVLFIDLDRFKPINDHYGHEAGDHLLCQVARRLRSCVRSSDVVARLGGDEFVVMIDLSMPGADPTLIGQRIVDRIAHPFATSHGTLNVTVSAGLAYGGLGSEPRDIVHRADLAAYQAKAAGGSALVLASP